jgi:ferredoxin-type protein NapH
MYVWLRRCVQLLVLLAFCLLPWMNALDMRQISGSLFALDVLGVPFADPVAAVQVAAVGATPGMRLLIGALCSLVLALLLGRIFCSWVCPYGLLSEIAHSITGPRKGARPVKGRGFTVKAAVLVCGLGAAWVWGFPALGMLSLPGELSLVPVLVWQGGGLWLLLGAAVLPLAALMLEMALGKRLWCHYVCPQSVLLGVAARGLPRSVPGLRIAWHADKCSCKGETPCRVACSLDLNPRRPGGPQRRDCTHCGDCLKACAARGKALHWRFGPVQQGGEGAQFCESRLQPPKKTA